MHIGVVGVVFVAGLPRSAHCKGERGGAQFDEALAVRVKDGVLVVGDVGVQACATAQQVFARAAYQRFVVVATV